MSPEEIQKTAQQTFALIVGIERYDLGDDWTPGVKGSIDYALRFLKWLDRSRVPLDNIFLHLSPKNSHASALPADLPSLKDSIRKLKDKRGEALYIYWAGHGYAKPDKKERRLYVADSGSQFQTLSFDSVLNFFGSEPITFPQQMAFVDACAVTTIDRSSQLTPYLFVEDQVDIVAEQFAHFACRIGEAARYQEGGLFSKELFDVIEDMTLPLNLNTFDAALGEKFDKLKGHGQRPIRYWARNASGDKEWDAGLDVKWRPLLAAFPLPRVATINPYEELHLTKGEVGAQYDFDTSLPPYITRGVDAKLDHELRGGAKLVVLVGPSKSGKSRTAFEALVRNCADLRLVIPDEIRDLRDILDRYDKLGIANGHGVLWLDNLHAFLNTEVVSPGTLQRLIGQHGLLVMATMWDNEYRKFMDLDTPAGPMEKMSAGVGQSARDILAHATVVRLEARMTASEQEAAKRVYPHLAFGPGIGESFVSRERLIDRFTNGSIELKAVMKAAVDLRRAGVSTSVPVQVLEDLFKPYYQQEDPGAWMPEKEWASRFLKGLSLAVNPVGQYQRLLNRDASTTTDAFTAYDPLVYYVDNDVNTTIPLDTWEAALNLPDVNLTSVGLAAHTRKEVAIAKKA